LDQEMLDAPSVNAFKGRLDKLRQGPIRQALAALDDWLSCDATQGRTM